MGKKHRNRIASPKKNNHIPKADIIAEHEAHGKEYSANKRKNGPGSNTDWVNVVTAPPFNGQGGHLCFLPSKGPSYILKI